MQFHRRKKISSLLNIAPLIDCVFLLLTFFLLTSSFIEEAGLEIEVPESASALPVEEKEIIVSLSEKGDLAINGRPSGIDRLQEDLAPLVVRLEKHQAIIKADKDVRLELLIRVMDLTKAAGIKAINIKTTPVSIEEIKNERNRHK